MRLKGRRLLINIDQHDQRFEYDTQAMLNLLPSSHLMYI